MPSPDYSRPPVMEVVCGVMFDAIEPFTTPYLGKLWERLPKEFVKIVETDPLLPVIERFDSPLSIEVSDSVLKSRRVWFINEKGDQLIQVQRDRFHVNWKKVSPNHDYPRYLSVKSAFDTYW